MQELLIVFLCYLIGSIPFSYLFGRILGKVDVRSRGSGNVGATNVFRTTGIRVALAALTADLLKGFLAAWIGIWAGGSIMIILCPLSAVIGHCFSVFLGFRGGKGVATAAGVLVCLMPDIFLVLLILLSLIVALSRYMSLASVSAACLLPVLTLLLNKPSSYTILSLIMAVLVIYKHRENIRRLRNGTEAKINEKA